MQSAVPLLIQEAVVSVSLQQQQFSITNSQIIMQKQSPTFHETNQLLHTRNAQNMFSQDLQDKIQEYSFLTSSLLKELIEEDTQPDTQSDFHSGALKDVDLQTYIKYVHSKTKFEPECLIIALIYIDRYNLQNQNFNLSIHNIHKLLLTCLLLAAKYHDQIYYDNKAFQCGGGINNIKLFELQLKVFQSLDFNLHIEQQYYFQFLKSMYNAYLSKEDEEQEGEEHQKESAQQEQITNQQSSLEKGVDHSLKTE